MKAARFVVVIGALLALLICGQPLLASQEFLISCEGIESAGGGINRYQYTLQNITFGPVVLTDVFIGTGDPNPSNYTFVPTPGFTEMIIPNDGVVASVLYTFQTKTPHGVVPGGQEAMAAAVIHWNGLAMIQGGGTITFAFDHPGPSWDFEWHVNSSAGWTISMPDSPIAGPTGVFSIGYVHAPAPLPQDFIMSCEGTESTGGGSNRYQYTLMNVSGGTMTFFDLYIGTDDMNPANYTFVPTPGFSPILWPNDGSVASVLYTDGIKTPHGVAPPLAQQASAAGIVWWSGAAAVPPGGTITFAFDHPGPSWNHEWHAFASGMPSGWIISQWNEPIPGPMGTYTYGWVHAPADYSCTCPYQSDFDADGFLTALDLAKMIDILFAGGLDPKDPLCPATRADFDCDGFATTLDLAAIIDHLFVSGPGPCDPCLCIPVYPDDCPPWP